MTDETCEVVITAPDPEWLAAFTRTLVDRRLVASGHNIAPIRSIYRWQGQVYDRTEARVSLQTRRTLVPTIIRLTRDEHPYEVPCVMAKPIIDGNPTYLRWIIDETTPEAA